MPAPVTIRPIEPHRPLALAWLLGVLLVLGCMAIYWHVTEFGFTTFDDDYNIVFNPHMGPLTTERVGWAFGDWNYARRSMPLGWLGFSAVFSVAGLNPAGYHLAGLGLHVINALLLFGVLCRLAVASLPAADLPVRRWQAVCAFLGAMFWAWHPLRVESVVWSSALLYGQANFFLLLALLVFVPAPASPSARLMALLCYGASLLSYPVAIGFAPVFALIAAWRLKDWRRGLWIALPFALPAAAMTAINLFARVQAGDAFLPVPTNAEFPLVARAMQACFLWVYYLWKPFWPAALTLLNPVLVDFDPWSAPFVISAVVFMVITALCIAWPVARRTAGWFFAAHLVVLVPMLGLVERPHFPSDRYSAFTQIVLAAALAVGLARLRAPRARIVIMAAGLAAGGVLAVLSARQTAVWHDATALFQHVTKALAPEKFPMMCIERPAVLLYRSGDAPAAIALFDRGLALLPHDRLLEAGRADLLRQWSELRTLLAAAGAPPTTPPVALMQQRLGVDAAHAGDWPAALAHLQLARDYSPDFYEPAYNLALVWLRLGETRAALGCYLWAEAHGGGHLSDTSRARVLGLIAGQFAAAGEPTLAAAVRAREIKARVD